MELGDGPGVFCVSGSGLSGGCAWAELYLHACSTRAIGCGAAPLSGVGRTIWRSAVIIVQVSVWIIKRSCPYVQSKRGHSLIASTDWLQKGAAGLSALVHSVVSLTLISCRCILTENMQQEECVNLHPAWMERQSSLLEQTQASGKRLRWTWPCEVTLKSMYSRAPL